MKLKLEKFETSFKDLTKLINSQISAKRKTGLGYDGQMNECDLNDVHVNEGEVLDNVFDNVFDDHESDGDDNQVNDRFKKCEGYYEVPLPYTGNYMPAKAELSFAGLDDSVFKFKVSETVTSVPKIETNASKTSKDSLKKPKTIRSSAPLIEEWESDIEDENLLDESQVLLKVPRNNNMYSFDLKNVAPLGYLTCLFVKATLGNQINGNAGTKANINAGQAGKKTIHGPQYVLLPLLTSDSQGPKSSEDEDVRDQEEAFQKQFEQEFERLFGLKEAANTNITNRINIVSSPVNAVSSSFTIVDPGKQRAQRNEFESMFGQDKDDNGNSTYRMFTPVSAGGSSYVDLSGSIPVNAATLPNADLPTDPLMPDLEDTADL
nr:ribonuclease H-like domain-containing protein [Tanacetum cinerariifolium]